MKSIKRTVRITELGYQIMMLAGIFSKVFVHFNLIIQGDALTKVKRIMLAEETHGKDSAWDLILLTCDVIVAQALRVVQKPIRRSYVLVMASLRLVGDIIHGISKLYRFLVLWANGDAGYLSIFIPDRLHSNDCQSFSGCDGHYTMG